jgi:hypothetical protein
MYELYTGKRLFDDSMSESDIVVELCNVSLFFLTQPPESARRKTKTLLGTNQLKLVRHLNTQLTQQRACCPVPAQRDEAEGTTKRGEERRALYPKASGEGPR